MRNTYLTLLVGVAVLVALGAVLAQSTAAQASTVGYWRFEDSPGFTADSGDYGYALTAVSNPSPSALPETGRGSAIHNPIPQNAWTNAQAADLDGNDMFTHPDEAPFSVGDFTIEAYVHADFDDYLRGIAGQATSASGQRAWMFAANPESSGDGLIRLHLSSSGNYENDYYAPDGSFQAGKDYYVAASVQVDSGGAGDDGVITFYWQNLTDGGALHSATVAHGKSSLRNSTAPLHIGAWYSNGTQRGWIGLIDEVRLSDEVLAPHRLLANVPEPSGLAVAMGLAMAGLSALGRRKRKR